MKNKCLRLVMTICLISVASMVMAYDFQMNGIYYSISSEGHQVSVVRGDNYGSYSGDIVIPEYVYYNGNSYNVTFIEWDAFDGSNGLTTVTVADAPISGFWAFRWCRNLKAFYVTYPEWQDARYLCAEDGVLMNVEKTEILAYPRGRKGSFTIPPTVSELYSETFDGCSIDTLTLSTSQITYTNYLGNIGANVLIFPEGVTTIGESVINWNGQTIMLPSTINSIGSNAFGTYDYPEKVYCLAAEPPVIAADAFGVQPNSWAGSTLYVPKGSEELYRSAQGWSGFTEYVGMAFNAPDTYDVAVAGTLKDILPDVSQLKTAITITGLLNGDDIIYLRSLFQGDSKLRRLDLSGAQMVEGGESYYSSLSKKYYTKDSHITPYLFDDFRSLRELVLPQTTEIIDDDGLRSLYYLQSVILPEGIRQVGSYAFSWCESLESVNLPNTIDSIGEGAFSGCEKLQTLTIPTSIAYLPNSICTGCKSLTTIHIPANVRFVKYPQYFLGCTQLTTITVADEHPLYTSVDGVVYSRDMKKLVLWPTAKDAGATATIPEGIEELGNSAMSGSMIKDVWCPISLRKVGEGAFYESNVEHIDLPYSVESIERVAFLYCRNLKTLTLPKYLKKIPEMMCDYCTSLTEIRIPATVTAIDSHAFESCDALVTVIAESRQPIAIDKRLIPDWDPFPTHRNISLIVPEGSKTDYEANYYWKEFKEIIEYEVENKQCATPTIAYDKGELVFSCETEGVKFFSAVKVADAKSNEGERVKLMPTYIISVYAQKEGYDDSDIATATIGWCNGKPMMEGFSSVTLEDDESRGDVNADGTVDVADIATIISIMAERARLQQLMGTDE